MLSMKNFILNNWFQLMLGSSLMMGSGGFLIHASASANAAPEGSKESLPKNEDGTITVRLAPDQLNELKTSLTAIQENTKVTESKSSGKAQDVWIVGWKEYGGRYLNNEKYLSSDHGLPIFNADYIN